MKTYKAKYNPKLNKGVYAISLVESPAMEGLFIALSKDNEIQLKEVEQRTLMGLVLQPNKPIYRNQGGEEFNIVFDAETIKELSHNFFKSNSHTNSTIEHSVKDKIEGVTFVESWIVENPENDKSNAFDFNYPKGSWMATMKVDSDQVWNEYVKTGKVQGFSIDAMLSLEEVKLSKNQTKDGLDIWFKDTMLTRGVNVQDLKGNDLQDGKYELMTEVIIDVKNGIVTDIQKVNLKTDINMSKEIEKSFMELLKDLPNQIKLALTPKQEIKLGSINTANGELTIEYDGETMVVGQNVWITAEDGTKVPVPVGEHPLEDGTVLIVTEDGVIAEVRTMPTEQAPTDMGGEDGKISNDAKIASEIESAIKSILIKYSEQEQKLVTLTAQVEDLGKQPASKGIKQPEFQVDLSKMNKQQRILHNLRNN